MLIAGRFMVDPDMVRVIGRSPFHDLVRSPCLLLKPIADTVAWDLGPVHP